MIWRKKIEAGSYALVDADAPDANVLARIDLTGRPGVDAYPWDWHVVGDPVEGRRATGVCDTMRCAVDCARYALGEADR